MSYLSATMEMAEESELERDTSSLDAGIRTRILLAPASTLVGSAVLTQLILISGVAIVMGVAVMSISTFIVELLVLAVIATALERGLLTLQDLGTITEIVGTLLLTVTTIMLALFNDGKNSDGAGRPVIDASSVAALKFS